jgi:hypothetical protein
MAKKSFFEAVLRTVGIPGLVLVFSLVLGSCANSEVGIDDLLQFMSNELKVSDMTAKQASAIGASDGYGVELDGSRVEIYKFDMKDEGQKTIINKTKKTNTLSILGSEIPVIVNGSFILFGYAQHPQKDKVVKSFKNYKGQKGDPTIAASGWNIGGIAYSSSFNEDYPVFGVSYVGYPKSLNPRDLLQESNLLALTNDKGAFKAKIENTKKAKGCLGVTLSLSSDGKKIAELQYYLISNDSNQQNYLTYVKYIVQDGDTTDSRYTGSEKSLGQVLGFFSGVMKQFYNTDALKSK